MAGVPMRTHTGISMPQDSELECSWASLCEGFPTYFWHVDIHVVLFSTFGKCCNYLKQVDSRCRLGGTGMYNFLLIFGAQGWWVMYNIYDIPVETQQGAVKSLE